MDKKEDTVVIDMVNDIFLNALRYKASDIHIEPREKELNVRFRVD
jgi:type II secretory ATPase GspE/PulE/Tfp pilus assembly ATPase PilB-like protein